MKSSGNTWPKSGPAVSANVALLADALPLIRQPLTPGEGTAPSSGANGRGADGHASSASMVSV